MHPERRYAEWRPVRGGRIPARWIGLVAGALVVLLIGILLRSVEYWPLFVGIVVGGAVSNRVAARRLDALRDDPDVGQFAATLALSRETSYGDDEGLVSFAEGWLVYTGRRAVFSVGAKDVRIVKHGKGDLSFGFDGPGGGHMARLALVNDERFERAVGEWVGAARISDAAVFPPARPAPGGSIGPPLVLGAFLAECVVVLATAFRDGSPFTVGASVVFGLIVLGIAVDYARDASRALRAIERGDPAAPTFADRQLAWPRKGVSKGEDSEC